MQGALLTAALGAMILGERDYLIGVEDDVRGNRRRLRNIDDKVDAAGDRINGFLTSGDYKRIVQPAVADAMLGLAYPPQPSPAESSPFASAPSTLQRPILTEAQAVGAVDWPGAVNRYDKNGNLVNPGEAADGQNFLTFVALGYREVRSALLGLTLPQDDTAPEIQAGFFRAFRGFATAIKEEATSGAPMTQEQMTEAMRAMLAAPKTSRGIVWYLPNSTPTTGPTSETVQLEIPFVKGLLKVGEVARLTFGGAVNLTGATSEWRVRFDSLSSSPLLAASFTGLTGSFRFRHTVEIQRLPDSAGNQFFGVIQASQMGTLSSSAGGDVVGFINDELDHKLVISWSFGAVSQSAFIRTAILEKL